jgi:Holliday junction resolvasome RuvABC endonuclease subunit
METRILPEGVTPREKIIVGIDPGITYAGFYALKANLDVPELSTPLVCTSFIEPLTKGKRKKNKNYWTWQAIATRVARWVHMNLSQQVLTGRPSLIAIEDFVWIGKARKSSLTMGKIIGVLYSSVGMSKAPCLVYSPGEWRARYTRFLVEDTRLETLQEMLREKSPPQNDHENDAFSIAVTCFFQTIIGEINVL